MTEISLSELVPVSLCRAESDGEHLRLSGYGAGAEINRTGDFPGRGAFHDEGGSKTVDEVLSGLRSRGSLTVQAIGREIPGQGAPL